MTSQGSSLTQKHPLKNQALKIKLKIKQAFKANLKEKDKEDSSKHGLYCNQRTTPRFHYPYPFSSQEFASEDKLLGISQQISLSTLHKNNPSDSPFKQILTTHNYRKQPDKYFAVNKNQFNIETKVINSRKYQPITSFETKWIRELERISHYYKNSDTRQIFYSNDTLSCLWKLAPNYDKYSEMKRIENRYAGIKFKSKLLPLGYKSKNYLNQFAKRFYYNKFVLPEKTKLEDILKKVTDNNNE